MVTRSARPSAGRFGHHRASNERERHHESTVNKRIDPWLQIIWEGHGSDLLLVSGSPPRVRLDGRLQCVAGAPPMSGAEIDEIVRSMLTPEQEGILEEHQDVDFSLTWLDRARLRGSAFNQRGRRRLPSG